MQTSSHNPQSPLSPSADTPAGGDVDFMSMLSHQLSTPIGAIRWYGELLRMGKMTTPLDAGQADMVNEIILGATRMSNLLNGIHDISRLEQNKFTDEPAPVVLADLIATIQTQHQAEVTAKRLQVSVAASQPGLSVVARPGIVSIIVQNLVSNAINYTPEGGTIQITVRPASSEEAARADVQNQDCVFLSIADTGCGIPQDQQSQVFSKFFRGENVVNMGIEGAGLGLAGVATAVSKLGGGVWFESEAGRGTTLFVVLPTGT
jgi:signal transduction histidine kinase